MKRLIRENRLMNSIPQSEKIIRLRKLSYIGSLSGTEYF